MLIAIAAFVVGTATDQPLDSPGVTLGDPEGATVEHVTAVQHVAPDHVRITLSFTLATPDSMGRNIVLPIEVPRDVAVTGLKLQLGAGTSIASFVWNEPARDGYDKIVDRERDPALLELQTSNATHHQMWLRVFPVTADTPARVTIELVAPRILPIPQAEHRIHKSKSARPMLGFGRQVGRKMSLFATDPHVGRRERE